MDTTLHFYTQQTLYTDPGGRGATLFAGLPESLTELCALIKCQLIHPSAMTSFGEALPAGRKCEDEIYATVSEILSGLVRRNSAGLISERAPAERLILSCRHHALLLTSILRTRGIPVRVRVGFCTYVATPESGLWEDHWITEVWNLAEERWMRVDPDIQRVDFPAEEFALAGEVWQEWRKSKKDLSAYGSGRWRGASYVRNNVIHDYDCLTGYEEMYGEGPKLFSYKGREIGNRYMKILDTLADYTTQPKEIEALQALREEYRELRYGS